MQEAPDINQIHANQQSPQSTDHGEGNMRSTWGGIHTWIEGEIEISSKKNGGVACKGLKYVKDLPTKGQVTLVMEINISHL